MRDHPVGDERRPPLARLPRRHQPQVAVGEERPHPGAARAVDQPVGVEHHPAVERAVEDVAHLLPPGAVRERPPRPLRPPRIEAEGARLAAAQRRPQPLDPHLQVVAVEADRHLVARRQHPYRAQREDLRERPAAGVLRGQPVVAGEEQESGGARPDLHPVDGVEVAARQPAVLEGAVPPEIGA